MYADNFAAAMLKYTSLLLMHLYLAFMSVPGPAAAQQSEGHNADAASDGVTPDAAISQLPPDLRLRKTGSDWPAFLGPTGDGKSSEQLLPERWLSGSLPVAWQHETGEGYGAPSVARGRLFLFDRVEDRARLSCLNSETGEVLWRFEYRTGYEDLYGFSNGPRAAPVVDSDRVYILGVEGVLSCLTVADGNVLWQINTSEKYGVVQNFFGVGSTPVIADSLLIVQVGGSPAGAAQNVLAAQGQVPANGSAIVAFHKQTGKVVYEAGDELASYSSLRVVRIDGRPWAFLFARGGLMGFNPYTGDIDFHFPWRAKVMESVNASNPVVAGNQVFISEAYGPGSAVLRVSEGTYEVVWKDPPRTREKVLSLHWNTAIHHEGYLFAGHGRRSSDGEIRCVELTTGQRIWSHKMGEHASLLYVDGHLIILGERGRLTLMRANPDRPEVLTSLKVVDAEGQELITYPAWAAPVLSHGRLYLRGKGRLVCLDLI